MTKNSVPAHAYYGVQVNGYRLSAVADARLAPPSAPYVGRGDKCSGNEDTCNANRVRGQLFCAGHMKSLAKAEAAVAAPEVELVVD
jgi:hypothetical protein